MIRTMLYRPATQEITTGNEALLATWQEQPDTILWADFSDNDPHAELATLAVSPMQGRFS